jgi:hypothetical protein
LLVVLVGAHAGQWLQTEVEQGHCRQGGCGCDQNIRQCGWRAAELLADSQ